MRRGWLALTIIWMGVIFFMSSIHNLELTGMLSSYDLILRKLAHISEYVILTVLMVNSVRAKSRKTYLLVAAFAFLYACSDELHQLYVPTRDGKMTDIAIDSTGILLGILLVKRTTRHDESTNIPDKVGQ